MTMKSPMKMVIGTMTNIDIREQAKRTIGTITAKLDDGLIKNLFDEPIDNAARQFRHKADCPMTHKMFHKVITDFVIQIYDQALNASWKLSAGPLSEAIALLEDHYQGTYGRGYIAAVLDANDAGEGGIDTVLHGLAEIIKDIERQKYVRGVFIMNIDPADWRLQCEIVKVLLEDYKPFLPGQMLQCKPWELVSQIPSIMSGYLCGDSTLQEILSYPP
jgi:hypothetical protein